MYHHPPVITAVYNESAGFQLVKEVKLQLQVRDKNAAELKQIISLTLGLDLYEWDLGSL